MSKITFLPSTEEVMKKEDKPQIVKEAVEALGALLAKPFSPEYGEVWNIVDAACCKAFDCAIEGSDSMPAPEPKEFDLSNPDKRMLKDCPEEAQNSYWVARKKGNLEAYNRKWGPSGRGHSNFGFWFEQCCNCIYRLAPEPVYVEWEAKDVPMPVCWLREIKLGNTNRLLPIMVSDRGILVHFRSANNDGAGEDMVMWKRLFDEWEHSTDGKTWSICGKESE